MKNYYQILDLQPDATDDQIKKQFKLELRAWKPGNFTNIEDIKLAEEKTRLITEAYETLSDPTRREAYDQAYKTYADRGELSAAVIEPAKDKKIEMNDLAEKDNLTEEQRTGKARYSLMILAGLGVILVSLLVFIVLNIVNKPAPGVATSTAVLVSVASMTPAAVTETPVDAGNITGCTNANCRRLHRKCHSGYHRQRPGNLPGSPDCSGCFG